MPKANASKGGQALRRRAKPASYLPLESRVVVFLVGLAVSLGSFWPGSGARPVVAAQEVAPDVTSVPATAARWEPVIAKFEAQEKVDPSPPGGIVFYGSSTIVRWDLKKYFPDLVAINRGFGGSQMADARYFVGRVVIPLRPKTVVVYSGDNDLARGDTPEKIAAEFRELCRLIHAQLPETRIIVLGVKPSLARAHLLEKQRTVNRLLQKLCENDPRLRFVDTEKLMLRADGSIRKELLAADGLHLSEEGYRLWTETLRPLLAEK
jgi:lysophospholipase L1-like esterase